MSKITPDDFNELIDDCIDHLCDDNPEYGAGTLIELAQLYKRAGYPVNVYVDTRTFIIRSAIERLGTQATPFIQYKLDLATQKAVKERNKSAHSNIIIH
jgi:hypothetical protein